MRSDEYFAGLFDGEGHYVINKVREKHFYPRAEIRLGLGSFEVLFLAQEKYGGSLQKHRTNRCLTLVLAVTDCYAFTHAVVPYLLLKKRQAYKILQLERVWLNLPEYGTLRIWNDKAKAIADAIRLDIHALNCFKGGKWKRSRLGNVLRQEEIGDSDQCHN
jgi:hypothetical protein